MQVGVLLSCNTSSVHSTAPLTVSVHIQHRSHLVGQSAPSALASGDKCRDAGRMAVVHRTQVIAQM